MKQKNLFFIIFIIVGCLIGFMLSYIFFGASKEGEVGANSFEDLPKKVQKLYIKKEEVQKLKPFLSVKKDDITLVNEPIEGSEGELKAQIWELRQTNQELYKENVELADKGWELALKLKEQESEILAEKERLKSKNLENINEAEQQHYKNVNDLTKRINQLQQQSIESATKYENQIVELENEVDELKQVVQKKEFNINEEINAATQKERISNSTLAEKNRHLIKQIKIMKDKMSEQIETYSNSLKLKKDEIIALKQNLNEKDSKTNALLAKHTKEMLELEQKHGALVRKLREDMLNAQKQYKDDIALKNSQITSLEQSKIKEAKELRNAIKSSEDDIRNALMLAKKDNQVSLDTIASLKKQNEALEQEVTKSKESFQALEGKVKTILNNKEQEYVQMLNGIKDKALTSQEQDNAMIRKLEKQILEDYDNIESLKTANANIKKDLEALKAKLKAGVNQATFEKNEARHAQNYKILNTKIVTLKKQRDEFVQSAKKELDNLEQVIAQKEDEIESLKSGATTNVVSNESGAINQESELRAKLDMLDGELSKKESEIVALKLSVKVLNQENQQIKTELQLQNSDDKQNVKIEKTLEQSLAKIASLEDDITILKKEKNTLKTENEELKSKNQNGLKEKIVSLTKELEETQNSLKNITNSKNLLIDERDKLLQERDTFALSKEDDLQAVKKALQDTNESLQKMENETLSLKGDIAVLETRNKELIKINEQLKSNPSYSQEDFDTMSNDLINRKAEILALKNEFDDMVKKNLRLEDEIKKFHSSKEVSQNKTTDKIASLEEELKILENENIELTQELKEAKNIATKEDIPKSSNKLELLGSIKCDDMPKGTNSPTLTCKQRVEEFLAKYDTNNFFEIIPIVDNGGFASLNKVSKSKLGISQDEIQRLTRLSNLGLGKDRAASGGELVREIMGDFVKISYAVTNKDIPKKRGFIINAYK